MGMEESGIPRERAVALPGLMDPPEAANRIGPENTVTFTADEMVILRTQVLSSINTPNPHMHPFGALNNMGPMTLGELAGALGEDTRHVKAIIAVLAKAGILELGSDPESEAFGRVSLGKMASEEGSY